MANLPQTISSSIYNNQQNEQNNEIELIPEQLIIQKLTQYFMSPITKPIPYMYYFTQHPSWAIYSLAYLYNFIRMPNHNKLMPEHFLKLLIDKSSNNTLEQINQNNNNQESSRIKQVIQQIINVDGKENGNSVTKNRKVLICKYISLPSTIAQYLSQKHISCRLIQTKIIQQVCGQLQFLYEEQRIQIINKIILLGYSSILIKILINKNANLEQIMKIYQWLIRKDAIIIALLKLILQIDDKFEGNKNILKNGLVKIITQHHLKQHNQTIIKVLSQAFLLPSQAQPIYDLILSPDPKLTETILQDLTIWWIQGNDYYLIYNSIKFKANLLALILLNMNKQQIASYSNKISLGIERRLLVATENRKEVVNLIWAILAEKIGFKLQSKFSTNLLKDCEKQREKQEQIKEIKSHSQKNKQLVSQIKDVPSPVQQAKSDQQKQQKNDGIYDQIIIKPPRNLYDCILGFKNSARKPLILKILPKMIRSNPEDLVFTWKDLITQLMFDLTRQSQPSVVAFFVTRPQAFIEFIGDNFFKKDHSLSDKIIIMDVLYEGVQELASKPQTVQSQPHHQQFYFKKVSSKYYKNTEKAQKQQKQIKDDNRTRRWGHTRIAHQRKLKQKESGTISLNIVQNQPHINRLYEIANHLYFRIISKLALLPIFPSQPMFTTPMLRLLAVLAFNLKNHIEKYKILVQIVDICLYVIQYLEKQNKQQKTSNFKQNNLKNWKDTHLAILNTLNKVSLVIDQFIPSRMLQILQKCITKLKTSQQYGINPIINMIQANIYTNASGTKSQY